MTTQQLTAARPSGGQTILGTVTKVSGPKSVVVTTSKRIRHPRYQKVIRQLTRVKAHDPVSQCHRGDLVELTLSRPISRTKRWRVVRVVKPAASPASSEVSL
ncbi:MAG TPA: 30S ribosomal protein S17 [Nitrospiria bacterium]|nr:30S ribosomal protein S17 [Nitrospiria bacterium]